jgi:hypothetical protein
MSIFRLSHALDAWIAAHPLFGLDRASSWSLYLAPLVLAILAVAVWRPARSWTRRRAALFLCLILAALLLARLPLLCYNFFNPDEALMLASAMRLTVDPVINRSADTQTDGALDCYVLTLPALAGQPLNYVTSRLTAAAEFFGTLAFLWMTFRFFLADWLAGLVLMPTLCFFVFAGESDFAHGSSEQFPMFLTAPILYLLAWVHKSGSPRHWRWAAIGVLAGALPFGKLQALPVAGMLLLIGIAVAWSKPNRRSAISILCAGAAAVPAFFTVMFLSTGAFEEFLRSYIGENILYARSGTASGFGKIPMAFDLIFNASSMGPYTYAVLLTAFAGLLACFGLALPRRQRWATSPRQLIDLSTASLLLLLAAFVSVVGPGRQFPHYLIFLAIPFALVTASAAGWIAAAGKPRWTFGSAAIAATLFFCLACVWPNVSRLDYADAWDTDHFDSDTTLVRTIHRYSSPQDRLVVWGWRSELHVASNRISGTRFCDSLHQIRDTPDRDYFRNLYMQDFQRSRPAVFVDAVGSGGFGYTDTAGAGYETFPALREAVDRDYRPLGELDGARAFVRKDRY